jgi:hypothetical protein
MKTKTVLWYVTLCILVEIYEGFGGMYVNASIYMILRMEAVCSFETLVFCYQTVQRRNPGP